MMDLNALKTRVIRMKFFGDVRGQSMVEFAVAAPVLATLLFAILYVSDLYVIKYETLVSSRYGAWRLARDDSLTLTNTKNNIAGYYFEDDNSLNIQEASAEEGTLEDISQEILDFVNSIFSSADHSTTYGLKVEYQVPLRLGYLDMSGELPSGFKIVSTHYVCGNAWDGCRNDVHEMFSMLVQSIGSVFNLFGSFP
jgi:hypothetical protein